MKGRKLVVRVSQLRNRIGVYVFSIYATEQLLQHILLVKTYLAFAEYLQKQCTIASEKLDCEPDDLIWFYLGYTTSVCTGRMVQLSWELDSKEL